MYDSANTSIVSELAPLSIAHPSIERGSFAAELPGAKSSQARNHVVIEVTRLLEDVKTTLESDFGAAKRAAARLAALLARELPDELPAAPARGGLAPWQSRKIRHHIENGLDGPLPIEALAKLVSLS